LLGWFVSAPAGAALEYHRGCLSVDRLTLGSRLPREEAEELDRLARAAMSLATSGHAFLLQRRHGGDDYSYLLIKRSTAETRDRRDRPAKAAGHAR
jgi:hypothetical protein